MLIILLILNNYLMPFHKNNKTQSKDVDEIYMSAQKYCAGFSFSQQVHFRLTVCLNLLIYNLGRLTSNLHIRTRLMQRTQCRILWLINYPWYESSMKLNIRLIKSNLTHCIKKDWRAYWRKANGSFAVFGKWYGQKGDDHYSCAVTGAKLNRSVCIWEPVCFRASAGIPPAG